MIPPRVRYEGYEDLLQSKCVYLGKGVRAS